MNIVYFAHSYRKEDAHIVEYIGRLLRNENMIPSLDPPSASVNAAKLERHLRATDGMIAVLTKRQEEVSPHILFEISLCIKGRKPILVFIEDSLPDNLVPQRILQMRFSRRSFLRQTREHRHALANMKSYLGDDPPPKYQSFLTKRACLILGVPPGLKEHVTNTISRIGYSPIEVSEVGALPIHDQSNYEKIVSSDVALSFIDGVSLNSQFYIGYVHSSLLPSITFTTRASYKYNPRVPKEYQPRIVEIRDRDSLSKTIEEEFALFEQDFMELNDLAQVDKYTELLLQVASPSGQYKPTVRNLFIQEVVMGDKYSAQRVGIQGRDIHVGNFNQVWNKVGSDISLKLLAEELAKLRTILETKANTPEQQKSVESIAEAEKAAKEGNGAKALEYISKAGKWALDTASEVISKIVVEAIKPHIGL